MKNKMLSTFAMGMIALMAMLSLSSCQKDGPVGSSDNSSTYDYMLAGPETVVGDVSEASLTEGFKLNVECDGMLFNGPKGKPMPPNPKQPPLKLGMLLRVLELSDDQKADVQEMLELFRECVETNRIALREAQLPIIEAANLERKAILDDLKDSVITRAEAQLALKALHQETRLAMETDEDVAAAREALKECHDTLLESLKAILTPAQLVKWNKFFQNRP